MAQRESNQGSNSRRWVVGIAVLAIAVLLFFGLRHAFHTDITVRVAAVEYQDILSTVSTNGKVEPVNNFQAYAPMPTVVSKLYVKIGQKVKANQPLLLLDDSEARKEIAAAQAVLQSNQAALHNLQNGGTQEELLTGKNDLSAAQLQVQQSEASLAAIQALAAKGDASANEVSATKLRLTQAQARVSVLQSHRTERYSTSDLTTAQSQVAQSRAALSAAESTLGTLDIRSPIAGTVYAVPTSAYDFVQTGESLVSVADLTHVQVRAYFDEPEIGQLAIGQPVAITWDARPNQVWHGHILQTPTTIFTYGTRNVGEALIAVDDANGDLLPNTNVIVKVTTQQRSHVLAVPREALHIEGTTKFVYKIINGHLSKATVQTGVVTLTRAEITGGLQLGDIVALGATTEVDLSNGLEVKEQQ